MAEGGLVGVWVDAMGYFRGTYVLCPACSEVVHRGDRAAREAVGAAVEAALSLAGAVPPPEAH
jgi:hypothetical protein